MPTPLKVYGQLTFHTTTLKLMQNIAPDL